MYEIPHNINYSYSHIVHYWKDNDGNGDDDDDDIHNVSLNFSPAAVSRYSLAR